MGRQLRRAADAQQDSVEAKEAADTLSGAVASLTEIAPAELLAASPIQGLRVIGDMIYLDGTPIKDLSGAEQMAFAVQIAKALKPHARILLIDGAEAIDSSSLNLFVAAATAEDYQIVMTRVSDEPFRIESLDAAFPA